MTTEEKQAKEAKAIVALAFRNGPIEEVHAGITCPTCSGKKEYSGITDPEMKNIMKEAVNTVYSLLQLKEEEPEKFETWIRLGSLYTHSWDEPEFNLRVTL